jgi:hypothetical protein
VKNLLTVGCVVALAAVGGSAGAQAEFPGPALGYDLMFRSGQLLAADVRAGHLWLVSQKEYVGLGVIGEGGIGLGGVSAGAGPVTMFDCVHAIGCVSVALQGKGFRPAWLSSWNDVWLAGGELSVGYYLLKATVSVFRPLSGSGGPVLSVGAGFQLFY